MLPFHLLFPEIGVSETRIVTLRPERRNPTGEHGFLEFFCVESNCDCRRALLVVRAPDELKPVAVISHAFDSSGADPELGRTFLDPLHPRTRRSQDMLDIFIGVLLTDEEYVKRLKRHYHAVKEAIRDPGHPIHARIAALTVPKRHDRPRRGEESPPSRNSRASTTPAQSRGRIAAPASATPPAKPRPSVVATPPAKPRTAAAAPAPVPAPPAIEPPPVAAIEVRRAGADWSAWTSALVAPADPAEIFLRIDFERLRLRGEFEDLLAPPLLPRIEKYWHQIETVRKALRRFHGRVLLADEVGLGKTIEAGLLIKEYLLRGLARRVLILTPATLVAQWREEMRSKFDLAFETPDDPLLERPPEAFWSGDLLIASLHTAKTRKNADAVAAESFDIVVVDEAHHLRNRGTLAWKLVNRLRKKFLFLLSATPVQNNLIELFNLITLLKPGQFRTESDFRRDYVAKGSDRRPANKERLRELLRDVMIRNTRSAIDLKLTKRYATTIRVEPTAAEVEAQAALEEMIRVGLADGRLRRQTAALLLREAGSGPSALASTLERLRARGSAMAFEPVLAALARLDRAAKETALVDLLARNPGEKAVVFFQFLGAMDRMAARLEKDGFAFARFRGDMGGAEKEAAVARFREEVPLLLSSESGGEGRNLQFANTIVNFDLPWNPMRIEQRIGRLHRIGQTRDVFVFNLAVRGTIEDHLLGILESKINMFEMVIGEIEPILGRLAERRQAAPDGAAPEADEAEFEDLIFDLWAAHPEAAERAAAFDRLGDEMVEARAAYVEGKRLDDEIFGEAFES